MTCKNCNGQHEDTAMVTATVDPESDAICRPCAAVMVYRGALRRIIENDLTKYDHHQPRRDGRLPKDAECPGSCWLTH